MSKIHNSIIILIMLLTGLIFSFFIYYCVPLKSDELQLRDMKGFVITAYCPGKCCNGKWAYLTSNGKNMGFYIGRGINIAAVDPRVIPLGSWLVYRDTQYLAVDVGSAIRGRHIDLLMFKHEDTEKFGVKTSQTIKIILNKKNKSDTLSSHILLSVNSIGAFIWNLL